MATMSDSAQRLEVPSITDPPPCRSGGFHSSHFGGFPVFWVLLFVAASTPCLSTCERPLPGRCSSLPARRTRFRSWSHPELPPVPARRAVLRPIVTYLNFRQITILQPREITHESFVACLRSVPVRC